jgi:hypothetical protein
MIHKAEAAVAYAARGGGLKAPRIDSRLRRFAYTKHLFTGFQYDALSHIVQSQITDATAGHEWIILAQIIGRLYPTRTVERHNTSQYTTTHATAYFCQ